MRAQVWNGKGWGLNPKGTWTEGEKLTAENCVVWLSEHSCIGPDRKTVTLTSGCAPEKATKHRCRSCGCKGRSCSLLCGCRGSCQTERAQSNEVSQIGDKAREDDNARDGDTCVPEDDGEGYDEPEIDVEADGEDGILEWKKSDDESCESDDDEVDPLVEGGEMGGGIPELLDDVQI